MLDVSGIVPDAVTGATYQEQKSQIFEEEHDLLLRLDRHVVCLSFSYGIHCVVFTVTCVFLRLSARHARLHQTCAVIHIIVWKNQRVTNSSRLVGVANPGPYLYVLSIRRRCFHNKLLAITHTVAPTICFNSHHLAKTFNKKDHVVAKVKQQNLPNQKKITVALVPNSGPLRACSQGETDHQ